MIGGREDGDGGGAAASVLAVKVEELMLAPTALVLVASVEELMLEVGFEPKVVTASAETTDSDWFVARRVIVGPSNCLAQSAN